MRSAYERRRAAKAAYAEQLRAEPDFPAAVQRAVDRLTAGFLADVHEVAEIAVLRERCTHPPELQEYWDDPSGNNGGGWECSFCDKDL